MIHITLILVDLMSGLVSAILWGAGTAIAGAVGALGMGALGFRWWRRRRLRR